VNDGAPTGPVELKGCPVVAPDDEELAALGALALDAQPANAAAPRASDTFSGAALAGVCNRNEARVEAYLRRRVRRDPDLLPDSLSIADAFALALNMLPPRYTQPGTIVFDEPVTERQIASAVEHAVAVVRARPRIVLDPRHARTADERVG